MHAFQINTDTQAVERVNLYGSALVDRAALSQAMAVVDRVIERRTQFPVLANVLVEGGPEGFRVTGTDLDIEVSVMIDAPSDPLSVTVPADTVVKLLKSAKASDMVAIDAMFRDDRARVALDFAGLSVNLNAIPANDFPILPPGEMSHAFTLDAKRFACALDKTAFAISTEETRYYLNGIFMHQDTDGLAFVATDGHRLSRYVAGYPDGAVSMPGVIIPAATARLLQWLLSRKEYRGVESVGVQVSDCKVRFTFGAVTILSKLIDGTFPDYHRVIPRHNAKRATFNASDLSEAVKQVSLISSERGRAIKFDPVDCGFKLSTLNEDIGHAVMQVQATLEGDDFPTIGFNSRYVVDILANTDGTATWWLDDAGSPALITDPSDDALTMVLMPMRT